MRLSPAPAVIYLFGLTFFVLSGSSSFAQIPPGHYETFDHWGLPPSLNLQDPAVQKFTTMLAGANHGGTLRTSTHDPFRMIFPGWFYQGEQEQTGAQFTSNTVFEGLMIDDIRANVRTLYPLIAKSFDVKQDGKTILVNLREDVRFSDGSLCDASSLLDSWKAYLADINGGSVLKYTAEKFGPHFEMIALSQFQVQVRFPDIPDDRLRDVVYNFLYGGLLIVKHNLTADPRIEIPMQYLGTGPYKVSAATSGQFTMSRREDYWNKQTNLYNFDKIQVVAIMDRVVERENFLAHHADLLNNQQVLHEIELDSQLNNSFFRRWDAPKNEDSLTSQGLFLNMDHGYLKDLRFRQALTLAYDFNKLNEIEYNGKLSRLASLGASSPLSPTGSPSADEKGWLAGDAMEAELNKPFAQMGLLALRNPEGASLRLRAAMQLFREMGFSFKDSRLYDPTNHPVELEALIRFEDPSEKLLEWYKADLRKIGIVLNIVVVPDTAALIKALRTNDYDLMPHDVEVPRNFDVLDPDIFAYRFDTENSITESPKGGTGTNWSNLRSANFDKIVAQLGITAPADPAYKTLMGAALRILSAYVPVILSGEQSTTTYYADKNLCLPAFDTVRLIEAAYYSKDGNCP